MLSNHRGRNATTRALGLVAASLVLSLAAAAQGSDWPQWGGPARDFKSEAKGLAAAWPEGGPRRLWSRELGEGYSAIAAEGGRLFTMYRRGAQDVVVALDAATGKTVWEYAYDAPFSAEYSMENGPGPHATPTVAGALVFAAGPTGKLHALDKKTGKLALVARPDDGVQGHRPRQRLRVQPARLPRHGDHDGRRRGQRARGLRAEDGARRLEEARLPQLARLARRHQRRRAGSARRLHVGHAGRRRAAHGRAALDAPAPDRVRSQREHARLGRGRQPALRLFVLRRREPRAEARRERARRPRSKRCGRTS